MKPTILLPLFLTGLVLSAAPKVAADGNGPRRPNIVILYADDMGYGDLSCQNSQSKISTPRLDRLAAEGTRFTDAHSSSGICTPSRYALLHGRYHWRKFNGIVNSFDQPILDAEKTTLPELLKTKGYKTACIGKWHLGWDWKAIQKPDGQSTTVSGAKGQKTVFAPDAFDWSKPVPGGPCSHGFDSYFGDDVPNFPPYAWFENDRVVTIPSGPLSTRQRPMEGSWETRPGPAVKDWDFYAVMPTLTKRAVEWIRSQDGHEPFFLYFAFTSPHAPIVPTPEFQGKSGAGGYGDYMVQTDAAVGSVLDALAEKGLAENTLVLFSSDNGPEHYAYERIRDHQHRSMGPLRGLKRDLYEGGHRVPFLVRWPGVVPAGRVNEGLLSQIDIYATLASMVGAEIPQGSAEDSINQASLIQGIGESARDTLVHNTAKNVYALRHKDWLLIPSSSGYHTNVPKWSGENNQSQGLKELLFNLKDDIGQSRNVYGENAEIVSKMKGLLEQSVAGNVGR